MSKPVHSALVERSPDREGLQRRFRACLLVRRRHDQLERRDLGAFRWAAESSDCEGAWSELAELDQKRVRTAADAKVTPIRENDGFGAAIACDLANHKGRNGNCDALRREESAGP